MIYVGPAKLNDYISPYFMTSRTGMYLNKQDTL